jgi:cytochrome c-type biogenesis protein CcmF
VNSTIGYGLVLVSLACAAFGAVVGFYSGFTGRAAGDVYSRRAVYGFFGCMLLANLTMVYALVTHDFSVGYVAQVGSRATPLVFTVVSLWSALEGSILFWGLIIGVYGFAFAYSHRRDSPRQMALAHGVLLTVAIFFAFLIAGPANPFTPVSPVPPDGPGPNPLLQNHILMIIHPPMLYMGYVGMTVPFSIAVAGLLRGELRESWMAPLRRWTLVAWTFLTLGIILGSWWAYAVLGWGGYWAWDPVENASFLPWLTATAFIHSTMVQERRKMLRLWTLSLALATFILTILGTFMTRSGVFNSVHSFTQSDIGPTFLVFIGFLLVVSIVLLTVRGPKLVAEGQIQSVVSRETTILLGNLLFVAITFTVLLGTTFPLITEALTAKKISVGEPYFNKMAVPLAIGILFLMGVGPALPWGKSDKATLLRQFLWPALFGLACVAGCLALGLHGFSPLLTFGLCGFVAWVTVRELFLPARVRMREHKENPVQAVVRSAQKSRRRFGGFIVHLGMVVIFAAVAASSNYVTHVQGTLRPDAPLSIGAYRMEFSGLASGQEPHRQWSGARIKVTDASGNSEEMVPRLNYYERSTDPIGTPAVQSKLHQDLYLSLLAFAPNGSSASINAWIFPLVGWIWWSIPILVLGALIAIWPARKRATSPVAASVAAKSGEPVQRGIA